MDAQREEPRLIYGELLYLRGRYVQYRATLTAARPGTGPVLRSLTLIFIDSRRGPTRRPRRKRWPWLHRASRQAR